MYRPCPDSQLLEVNKVSVPPTPATACTDRLGPRGLLLRVVATLTGAALLLAGTIAGTDDHFPFGPFRMYATAEKPDTLVADTRIEGVDTAGRRLTLTQADTGIRRAEIEGQLDHLSAQPARLSAVARAYEHRNPGASPLSTLIVVVRWHEVRGGHLTGRHHDEVEVEWHR
jgi:hypothetical protein